MYNISLSSETQGSLLGSGVDKVKLSLLLIELYLRFQKLTWNCFFSLCGYYNFLC